LLKEKGNMTGNTNKRSNGGLSPLALGLLVLALLGFWRLMSSGSVGPGSHIENAPYKADCTGPIGKWVSCKGKVLAITNNHGKHSILVELKDGSEVTLVLNNYDPTEIQLEGPVSFKVNSNMSNFYRDDDVAELTGMRDLERYCTGQSWNERKQEQIAFGWDVVMIDPETHPKLSEEGFKLVSIRGEEVVAVEEFLGRREDCIEGEPMGLDTY
jgi:small nuclear ribonucleoprotein (snRNP)-like protein